MGEIKSTLDLVMEKTRGMTLSSEEKERLKKEGLINKAKGFFHKYEEGIWRLKELQENVERDPEADPKELKRQVSLIMIERLGPEMKDYLGWEDLKSWLGPAAEQDLDRARKILEDYRRDSQALYTETEQRIKEGLARKGIWGSAVKAKVEGDRRWKEGQEELKRQVSNKLDNIKKNLTKLI